MSYDVVMLNYVTYIGISLKVICDSIIFIRSVEAAAQKTRIIYQPLPTSFKQYLRYLLFIGNFLQSFKRQLKIPIYSQQSSKLTSCINCMCKIVTFCCSYYIRLRNRTIGDTSRPSCSDWRWLQYGIILDFAKLLCHRPLVSLALCNARVSNSMHKGAP